jgi:hypothetical protein
MSEIDRKRIAAVWVLEARGYRFEAGEWRPGDEQPFWPEADRLHALLMNRAEVLSGCIEDSPEEDELRTIADALEAYEARRWPAGKFAGGKG